jgi:hypothetical protein
MKEGYTKILKALAFVLLSLVLATNLVLAGTKTNVSKRWSLLSKKTTELGTEPLHNFTDFECDVLWLFRQILDEDDWVPGKISK